MRFFLHGNVTPEVIAALQRHGHAVHQTPELAPDTDAPETVLADPQALLKILAQRQWQLFTTDGDFVHRLYDAKVAFPGGLIVLLLEDAAAAQDQGPAIDRLFARYKRLTPKRLYTITPSRVKIRQLPGLT
jgi:hypothetical protein